MSKRNVPFYLIAFTLLALIFLFFGLAYKQLTHYSELTDRRNVVYRSFQNLSTQVTSAANGNPDLNKASNSLKVGDLFFADSLSVIRRLDSLNLVVRDPVNIKIAHSLDTTIKSELSWILKSDVADSIIHHTALTHIAAINKIDSLIERGKERTIFLLAHDKESLNEAIDGVIAWMIAFIILSSALLIYTTLNYFRQKSKTESKEKELEKTETQFRHALDNMLEGVQIHDLNWRYTYVNDAAIKHSIYSREELLGYTLMEKYPGIENTQLFEVFHRCMTERVAEQIETEFIFPNGTKGDFELSIVPTPEGLFILSVNITERKKAEQQQVLFASIINSSDDAILSKTLDGIITSWNHGAEKVFGYFPVEIIGKHVSILIPSYLQHEENEIIGKIRRGEFVDHYETKRIRRDGKIIDVSLTISPIKDASGNIIGASKISRDISVQKEAEQKIIKSNRLYAFLSAINQSIVHIRDEQELTDKACAIATNIGQFKTAWVGLLDNNGILNIISIEGDPEVAMQVRKYSGLDSNNPQFKTTTISEVLSTEKYVVKNDVQNDPSAKIFKEIYLRFGIKATITFPIKKFGKAIGVFGFHSVKESFFDKDEIALLEEAAVDISFALENFEKEKLRTKIEGEVLQNEAMMKEAQRLAQLGSLDADFEKNITKWSDELYKILGYEVGKVEPSFGSLLKRVHPDDVDKVKESTEHAIAKLESLHREFRLKMEDGTIKFIESELRIKRNKEGKVTHVTGFNQDVTEMRLAQELLKKSEANLHTIFDNTSTGYVLFDTDFKIISFNQHAQKFAQEDLHKTLTEGGYAITYYPEQQQEAVKNIMEKVLKGKSIQTEASYPLPDGSLRWYEVNFFPVTRNGEQAYGMVMSLSDSTERKISEIVREQMTSDIIQRNKDLEQFSYIVSHNLRLPVANIIGLATASQNEDLEPQIKKEVMEGLSQSAKKLDEVIVDLNDILKVRREVGEKKEIVSFSLLAADIKSSIENLIEKEKAIIVWDFSEVDEMLTLKSYLHSIFYNLISNSIKYHQPGIAPKIEISSHRRNSKIELLFKDNGMGIDLKRKGDQVFGLYKRFHTGSAEGKGIGLYMVKTQVETIGGKISIESEVNRGTIFKIKIEI